jgi:putative ubiquitin-RnfH superfamily antitoxin RatB of RatAB toxin-antitoxin module
MPSPDPALGAVPQAAGATAVAVEVVYAPPPPAAACVIALQVAPGSSIQQAIEASGVLARYPEIDLARNKVGIYGKLAALDTAVAPRDRIEIYRPLSVDPKVARQRRVEKVRAAGSVEGRKWVAKERR